MSTSNPQAGKTSFEFKLTAGQAQTIFNVLACFVEEPDLYRSIFRKPADRRRVRNSISRFERQLNRQYARTGIEILI